MQNKRKDKDNLKLWEKIWSDSAKDKNCEEFYQWVKRDSSGVRGTKIQEYISENCGKINELKTIEVGSGLGTFSYLFSKLGADVTLFDISKNALEAAEEIYTNDNVEANFLKGDAFSCDRQLYKKYDVAMSFGTVEHFDYPERLEIIKTHLKLIRKGGIAIVSVPNKLFMPHELLKFYLCRRGKWELGYERAFTRMELSRVAKKVGLDNVVIIGSSFFYDVQRYVKIYRATSLAVKFFGRVTNKKPAQDRPSCLDNIFGADIVLMGVKKN